MTPEQRAELERLLGNFAYSVEWERGMHHGVGPSHEDAKANLIAFVDRLAGTEALTEAKKQV